MPDTITVVETYESRKLRKGVGATSILDVILKTYGSEDEEQVSAKVEEWLQDYYVVSGVRYRYDSYDLQHVGAGIYECNARYEGRPPVQIRIDSTGGTQRITQSLRTVKRYGALYNSGGELVGQMAEEDVPDFKGAIGFDGEKVEGCDIVIPQMNVVETFRLDPEEFDGSYVRTIRDLTGSVNEAPFRLWDAGEVLFLGGQAGQRGTEQWELTLNYAISTNEDAIFVGDIGPIEKLGWDYLWVRYVDSADKNSQVRVPRYAYVEEVYPRNDLTLLYPNGGTDPGVGLGFGVDGGGEGEGEE